MKQFNIECLPFARTPFLAEAETGGIAQFGVDWFALGTQVILFIFVYLVLKKYAFKPVVAMLEERRKRIEESQLNAEKIKKHLDEAKEESESIVNKAHSDAQHLMEEARASGERLVEQKREQAKQEAEQIIQKANESIDMEKHRVKDEMRREMGRLVVETTQHVTGKVLNADDQQRINADAESQFSA